MPWNPSLFVPRAPFILCITRTLFLFTMPNSPLSIYPHTFSHVGWAQPLSLLTRDLFFFNLYRLFLGPFPFTAWLSQSNCWFTSIHSLSADRSLPQLFFLVFLFLLFCAGCLILASTYSIVELACMSSMNLVVFASV